MNRELSPEENTKINFFAASAFIRKYKVFPKPIVLTGKDRGRRISLDKGYLIIDRKWRSTRK